MNNMNREKNDSGNTDKGIFLTVRQLSFSIAAILFLSIVIFIAGYLWGQKKFVETISDKMEQEGFSDNVSSSLISLYDSESIVAADDQEDLLDNKSEQKKEIESRETLEERIVGPDKKKETEKDPKRKEIEEQDPNIYHAQLVGGTNKAMIQFKNRLKKHGIEVVVKRRKGKTKAGKQIIWHQAITEQFDKREDLENLIEKVKLLEKLKDVNIIVQKKG